MYQIRSYQPGEEEELHQLFFDTVHNVNQRDYTAEQLRAWAPQPYNSVNWASRVQQSEPFVALHNEQIVGFADVQSDGYIDFFFCHSQYQGKGVGKALMNYLLNTGRRYGVKRFYANVSKTAQPFFLHYGFTVLQQQQIEVRGQVLTNYLMEKRTG